MAIRRCSSTYLATWGGPVCRRFSLYFSLSLSFSLCVSFCVSLTLVALFFWQIAAISFVALRELRPSQIYCPKGNKSLTGLDSCVLPQKPQSCLTRSPSLSLSISLSVSHSYCLPLSFFLSFCLLFHVCLKTLERISRLPSPFSRCSFETLLPRLLTNFSHIFVMSSWFFSSWNETEIKSEH